MTKIIPLPVYCRNGPGYDYTSVPVLMTAFAAAFLGSIVSSLLSGDVASRVSTLLKVDELHVPVVGTDGVKVEVPRFLWK